MKNEERCKSKKRKKWNIHGGKSQVLVFCSMARVGWSGTVVWVCVEGQIFTSVSGDGGL